MASDNHEGAVERDDINIPVEVSEQEWQCIECGTVVEDTTRPSICPHCNTSDGDFKFGVRVMARRDAVGWFE